MIHKYFGVLYVYNIQPSPSISHSNISPSTLLLYRWAVTPRSATRAGVPRHIARVSGNLRPYWCIRRKECRLGVVVEFLKYSHVKVTKTWELVCLSR